MSAGNDREFIEFQQSKEKGGRSMKCPLAAIGLLANGDKKVNEKCGCVKEECAWWVATEGRCAALSLTDRLTMLMLDLRKIREKMPHEEQFRR